MQKRGIESCGREHIVFLSDGFLDGGNGMNTMRNGITECFTFETSQSLDGSYERLGDLKMPILITHGRVSSSCPL